MRLPLQTTLLLTGLVIATWVFWTPHFEQFVFSKFLIIFLIGAWSLGSLLGHLNISRTNRVFLILSLTFISWFAFLAVASDVTHTAFFGVLGRNMGFLAYLALVLISLLFASSTSELLLRKTLLAFSISTVGIAVYGTIQILNLDPWDWELLFDGIIGNFGNPNFMGVLGAWFGILAVFLTITSKKSWKFNAIGVLGFLLASSLIYNSKSTQGWVILFLGLIPILYLITMRLSRKIRGLLALSLCSIVTISGLAIFKIGPLSPLIYQESLLYRFEYWRIAWKMAVDHPLFGVGIDRYQNFYREYVSLEHVRRVGAEDFSDSAHNIYLHLAATGGFPLAILLLLINLFVFYRFVVAFRRAQSLKPEIALIFGLWLGIQAQSLISVDYPSIALWGWVFTGLAVGISSLETLTNNQAHSKQERKFPGLLVSGIATTLAVFVIAPIASSQTQLRTGFYAYIPKGDNNAIEIKSSFLKQVEAKSPNDPELPLLSANSLFQDGAYAEAIDASRRAIALDAHDYRSWWFIATSLERLGKRVEALEPRQTSIELSPLNVANLLELAKNQIASGNVNGVRLTQERIALVEPNSSALNEIEALLQELP